MLYYYTCIIIHLLRRSVIDDYHVNGKLSADRGGECVQYCGSEFFSDRKLYVYIFMHMRVHVCVYATVLIIVYYCKKNIIKFTLLLSVWHFLLNRDKYVICKVCTYYIYMYVYIYTICACICIYTYIYTHIYICIYMCIYIYIYIYVNIEIPVYSIDLYVYMQIS